MRPSALLYAALATSARAQRPANTSLCDYYTKSLLKEVTPQNEATLLTLLVNTVVIGNYTQPNVGIKVPGILAPGTVNGERVDLLPYFNGALRSSNRGGDAGVSVNFLDGGGAKPLMQNKPANDNTSNQYFLLIHLYAFFGSLLGCTTQGMPGFDPYKGHTSMYQVHKFMDLDLAAVTYFIMQVGLAASSFGVADEDVALVAASLGKLFGFRCAAPVSVISGAGPELQAICIDAASCPVASNATCGVYAPPVVPSMGGNASMTSMMPGSMTTNATVSISGTMTMPSGPASTSAASTPTMSSTMKPPTAAAASQGLSLAALAAGAFAIIL